ncbi:MAG TPA: neocarzinostatin apoprotein domain-containing protein, partial [Acidimicrobiales bacterium]|nr:neocarzinostatin apoprotein domain-containing protein [Acidimicrobiales bacterium]
LMAPGVTVVPSTGLVPGTQVAFAATGFPRDAALQVDECVRPALGALDWSTCAPIAPSLVPVGADGSARGVATVVTGPLGAHGATCPPAPPAHCVLAAVAVGGPAAEADALLSFDGPTPRPVGTPPVASPRTAAPGTPAPGTPAPGTPAPRTAPPPAATPHVALPTAVAPPVAAAPTAAPAALHALSAREGPVGASRQPTQPTRRWALALVALVVAGLLAGGVRARTMRRR